MRREATEEVPEPLQRCNNTADGRTGGLVGHRGCDRHECAATRKEKSLDRLTLPRP